LNERRKQKEFEKIGRFIKEKIKITRNYQSCGERR